MRSAWSYDGTVGHGQDLYSVYPVKSKRLSLLMKAGYNISLHIDEDLEDIMSLSRAVSVVTRSALCSSIVKVWRV